VKNLGDGRTMSQLLMLALYVTERKMGVGVN